MNCKKISFWLFLLLAVVMFLVQGCADSSTKGAIKDVDSKITIDIHDNTGDVNIYPGTDLAGNMGASDQDTKNSASIDPKTTANAGWNGGSASGQMEAAGAVAELAGDYLKDLSQKDANNKNESTQVTPTPPAVSAPAAEVGTGASESVIEGYNSVWLVEPLRINGNRSWERFAKNATTPGTTFGETALVEWSNGWTMLVPDTSANSEEMREGVRIAWSNGTDYKEGEGQGQTGGVWGPKEATWYKIHYNR